MVQNIYKPERLFGLWPFFLGLAAAYLASGILMGPSLGGGGDLGAMSGAAGGSTAQSLDVIFEKNILSLDHPLPQKEVVPTVDPDTWTLLGILDGEKKMALLHVKSETKAVKQGEGVDGWILAEIGPSHVTFASGRTEKTLKLFDKEAAPKIQLKSNERTKISLSKSALAPVLDDPNALLQQALFKPYKRGSRVRGFTVDKIQGNSILRKIGIQNGDVLVRINGDIIDGPGKMMKLYSGLRSANSVKLDIRRGSEMLGIILELN